MSMELLSLKTGREDRREVGDKREQARFRLTGRRNSGRRNSCLAIEYFMKTTKNFFLRLLTITGAGAVQVYQWMINYRDISPPCVRHPLLLS